MAANGRMWRGLVGLLGAVVGAPALGQVYPPPNFTVAFFGDQGLGTNSVAVLQLVANEGADMVLHLGDFDYDDDPAAWEAQIDSVLGANFPYFAVVGNHDALRFFEAGGYRDRIQARMVRLGIPWQGFAGELASFRYRGIFVVMTAPGIFADFDPNNVASDYIQQQLQADNSAWSISAWHKNQRNMQVGSKQDETGWGVYETSRQGGAIIATGHEHSYSRTHLLSNVTSQVVASTDDTLVLQANDPSTPSDEGRSFAFVSGLGGEGIRNQDRDGAWWASIYTSDQGATFGALFGTFNYQGNPCLAHFYFKDIDGMVIDEFLVRSTCGPCAAGQTPGTKVRPAGTPTGTVTLPGP